MAPGMDGNGFAHSKTLQTQGHVHLWADLHHRDETTDEQVPTLFLLKTNENIEREDVIESLMKSQYEA